MIEINNIIDVEQYISDIDVVLFDLDDTLYSEKDYVRSGYRKIANYFNIPAFYDELWNVFEQGGKAIDEVLSKHNMLECKTEALKIYREQEPEISLYPGVRDMLERIKKVHPIGIITDGRPEGQRAKIKSLYLNVDKIIITDELGGIEFRKPNPKAFELMQDYFNVPFDKMVYIGDNINKDFTGPKILGMQMIHFINNDGIYR